jgi:cell division protein FtsI/penicillin-binding protein 2
MTFGQNLGITMIQTATAFSAVVNGGVWHTPTVVAGTLENGEINTESSSNIASKISDQILSGETSATMREMLIHNRDYKKRQGIDRAGYDVGGKSGTAQTVVNGSYDDSFNQMVGSY